MIVRVKKEDSAYLYQILESYEGLANFSTVNEQKGSPFREIALHVAPDLRGDVERLVSCLKGEIGLEVIDYDFDGRLPGGVIPVRE